MCPWVVAEPLNSQAGEGTDSSPGEEKLSPEDQGPYMGFTQLYTAPPLYKKKSVISPLLVPEGIGLADVFCTAC